MKPYRVMVGILSDRGKWLAVSRVGFDDFAEAAKLYENLGSTLNPGVPANPAISPGVVFGRVVRGKAERAGIDDETLAGFVSRATKGRTSKPDEIAMGREVHAVQKLITDETKKRARGREKANK